MICNGTSQRYFVGFTASVKQTLSDYAARLTQCHYAARLVPFRSVSFKRPCDVIHEELKNKYRRKKTALFFCMLKLSQ